MKRSKYYFLSFIFLIIFSCVNPSTTIDSNSLIKVWKLDYIDLNGKKVEHLHPGDEEFDYEFLPDSSYLIKSVQNSGRGFWQKDTIDNFIYLKNHNNDIYGKIIKVSEKSLIMIPVLDRSDESVLVKYYYIPK